MDSRSLARDGLGAKQDWISFRRRRHAEANVYTRAKMLAANAPTTSNAVIAS